LENLRSRKQELEPDKPYCKSGSLRDVFEKYSRCSRRFLVHNAYEVQKEVCETSKSYNIKIKEALVDEPSAAEFG